jgi:glutathione S-transferase
MSVKLHYWDIRGLAQVPRFLLALAGVDFADVLYTSDESWQAAKAAMNSAFPNCPALEHPDLPFTLTESKAIIQFLGRKYNLYGSNLVEQALIDNIIYRMEDVRSAFTGIAYGSKNWEADKAAFIKALPERLSVFEKLLGGRKTEWAASNQISTADVFLFEVSEVLSQFAPEAFAGLPHLVQHREKVRAHPLLKNALAVASKLRFNGSEAHWN